ncbi:hypothetical protein ABZT51_48945 [Streptomyces sp. NPDC005373]|uniref:hypothetical protein n=1 Tax=Streptomyces sp. NPDC005373 TaxID=3156879 RepID=UPI0033AA13B7
MGTNLDGFLHDIAQSLRARGDEPLKRLLQRQRSTFSGMWQDQDLAALTSRFHGVGRPVGDPKREECS